MPLMGSLYVGASGLQTSQNALNTTAHNLSNVDTHGYTRQQVQQADKRYVTLSTDPNSISNKQTGLGVIYSRVKQVRDYFLDKAYRREIGRGQFYQVSADVLEEVESQLGELNGEAFQHAVSDLWTSIQELAKDPTSSVTQGLLVQRSSEFIERATAVYEGLSSYQDNLNIHIEQQVDKINEYGEQLLAMNDEIRLIECGGVERANDLRDARNVILDEIAELTEMSFVEEADGSVSVKIEGVDFVKSGTLYKMSLKTDASTGFHTPFWPQNASYTVLDDETKEYHIDGAEVFDLEREISADLNTDIGGLKAMLLARGGHRADYTDVQPEKYDGVRQSVIMNVQAEFDQLVHNITSKMNTILSEAAGCKRGNLQLANGEELTDVWYCKSNTEGYMRNEDGSPIQMFTKISTDGYQKVLGADGNEYWVYQEEDIERQESLYTLKNLQIDQGLMQKPSKLSFLLDDKSIDNETIDKLKDAFTEEIYTLNPSVLKKTTFMDYYNDLVAQVGNSGYVYRGIYENQEHTVESTESARGQLVDVSSDEELANMIKFQNAYNASSRYINVISEMLEHIVSTLGV